MTLNFHSSQYIYASIWVHVDFLGEIPTWINGTLLKNGPGIFEVGTDKYNHWFDGLAILQRFQVENGKVLFYVFENTVPSEPTPRIIVFQVYYSSKYLRSEAYQRNMAAQRIVVSEFGTVAYPDPCKNLFHRYN